MQARLDFVTVRLADRSHIEREDLDRTGFRSLGQQVE